MKRKIAFACLCMMFSVLAKSQDSTLMRKKLAEVEIIEKRPTIQAITPYAADKSLSLADLLDRNSGNLVKFNGPVGVASLNLGGLGGQHSAIIWNGVNLQSGMNGFSDLNLLPVFLFDEVEFGTDFGDQPFGGALGGSVKLNNYRTRNELLLSGASFGNYKAGIALSPINTAKFKLSTKFYAASGQNNFSYDKPSQGNVQLQNALFRQQHVNTSFSYLINSKSQIKVEHWLMGAYRQIPPTLFEQVKNAHQTDRNNRLAATYLHSFDNDNRSRTFSARLNYLNEYIGYTDSLVGIFANNHAQNLLASAKQGWHHLNYVNDVSTSFFLGATAGINTVKTDDYISDLDNNFKNASVQARFQQKGFSDKWVYNLGAKLENYLGHTPLAYDANIKYRFDEKVWLSLFGGKTYRFPTFNDMFWSPGGNANLQPENAYKAHIQLEWKNEKGLRLWTQLHTAFVDNWIMWLPNQQGIWEAQNIKSVWARGIDFKYSYYKYFWGWNFTSSGNYSLTRTENLGTSNFVSDGSQLSYVPFHKANIEFKLQKRSFAFKWHHQYVGLRYINSDNSQSLKPYQLDNFSVGYTYRSLNLMAEIRNLFNVDFQSTAMYPMPGRNFSITAHYNLNNFIKKHVR